MMQPVTELLSNLSQLNIKLWAEGDALRYSAPKGALTPAHVAELKQRKAEILAALAASANALRPGLATGALSFAQERLWFLDQLEPGNPFYNVFFALRLTGELNLAALQDALNTLIARHAVLRTTFSLQAGQPAAQVAPELTLILTPRPIAEADLTPLALAEARLPFNLATGPLIRTTLLRLSETDHALLLTLHHIIADGWSMGVMVKELGAFYSSLPQRESEAGGEGRLQYADFAAWQRQHLTGSVLQRQLDYWVQQLANLPAELNLPTDRARPLQQSFCGQSERFTLDLALTKQLHALSQQNSTTLFMTLSAAFAVLLARYSRQEDVVFGTPIANRQRRELEDLLGFFVNTLVMRVDVSGTPTFVELLRRTRRVALDAYAHQDLPFEKLVEALQPERDLSRNPLFQVMFALQNAPVDELRLPHLIVQPIETPRVTALFDMTLDMWETPAGLVGVWEYNTDLFDAATVRRFVGHFQTLLAGICAAPETPVLQLPLLTAIEREALLTFGDGPPQTYPVDRTIPELFEAQVAVEPERVAAVHNGATLTYAELNARANQIANQLIALGVQVNDFVAILDERGLDFLCALLGVLKAGAAYIPIDPAYPEDRIQYMLANSATPYLLTHAVLLAKLPAPPAHVILLENVFDSTASRLLPASRPFCTPHSRAYMLYTSGSTGLPKGALLQHAGVINHIYGQFDWLKFHRASAFLQSAPASSDISVWQFLAPVLCGGRTVIADLETVADPQKLFAYMRDNEVTLVEFVPVVMKALLDYAATLPDRALPKLEWAMATGEAVSAALVNQWLALYPHIPIVNAYGPTEAADDVTQYVLRHPLPPEARTVPIGTPLANVAVYVLDAHLQLAPVGVPGELCVSGINVGEGYWRNPEKTAAAFLPNPYSRHAHDKVLYRTGDLGRWRADGVLECLERLDFQVKLRGFRIELGEIEALLDQHALVEKSAVAVQADARGEKHLVAYVVPSRAGQPEAPLHAAQVALWHDLHEKSYRDPLYLHDDPMCNVIGWDSSYTNQPLPPADMRDYIQHTVQRVVVLRPKHLLEIGCGTGLLAWQLIPQCEQYIGLDVSSVAIDQLRTLQHHPAIQARVPRVAHAQFLSREATQLHDLGQFDVVILPSVVQYFPSVDYLRHLLALLVEHAQPRAILLGDVRNLRLLEAFHASVLAHKSGEPLTAAQLKTLTQAQWQHEQELAVAPEFFEALHGVLPTLDQVEILPKRGRHKNELTCFRYDVVLHFDAPSKAVAISLTPYAGAPLTLADIKHRLATAQSAWGLSGLSNARLTHDLALWRWMSAGSTQVPFAPEISAGFEPEDLWALANDDWQVMVRLTPDSTEGALDVLFTPTGQPAAFPSVTSAPRPRAHYANHPLQEKLTRALVPQWRAFLRDKLPAHMVPAYFVVLDALPLTPNGKVNRSGLPPLDIARHATPAGYVPPRTPLEGHLCALWANVLNVAQVGVTDNFFELGGHSLKATQVINRLHQELRVELPLRMLFNHPTVEALARAVADLQPQTAIAIARAPEADDYPLSPAQRRLWVLAQLPGASAAYNMPAALHLRGALDVTTLRHALAQLLQRHEALRTTFITPQQEPRQKIHAWTEPPFIFRDLRSTTDPEAEAHELAEADSVQSFDLDAGPLWRVTLLQLATENFVLLFNIHHIVSDAWSEGVLVRELLQLYGGAPLPPLEVHYRDYAVWQAAQLASPAWQAARNYWRGQLAGDLPLLDFPTDFARPPVKTYRGANHAFRISPAQTAALHALARTHNASLFMALLALVKALLYRYTQQTDLRVGSPIAGRALTVLENQIGFYLNLLVFRTAVHGEESFAALLERVRHTTTEAYDQQAYPFDQLVNDLHLARDVSRNPLFDVAVVLQNVDPPLLTLPNVDIQPFLTSALAAKFDLQFSFEVRAEALQVDLTYNTDLYRADRVERLAAHFQTLLTSVLADPARPLNQLWWIPPAELETIRGLSAARGNYASPDTLVTWFERQVAATPSAPALTFEAQTLTYAELNARANQVARQLVARGVNVGDYVGLFLERSVEMVVGLLGILKAGGAYVPFDPTSPAERLAFMLNDAGIKVLVTHSSLAKAAPCETLCLDVADLSTESIENLGRAIGPQSPAYIIYTSGSTGQPKGCIVTHANVTRLFTATDHWYHFGVHDVWTLFHSIAFDFSVWELWGALLYGGRVVVVPHLVSRSPEAFHQLLQREGVTVLNQTPSAFKQLIQADLKQPPLQNALPSVLERAGGEAPLALRYVIFGGEALDLPSLRPWFDAHGDTQPQLVNMYGITETTVHVTYRPLTRTDVASSASLIGQPIPDLELHILDAWQQPVPLGVPGEIYVGGAGVSNGYLNRSELTAHRFISHLTLTTHPARLYRTGDLARFTANGDIEYLGRIDSQVKIRGFRIELGEIEALLTAHPAVQTAAVIVRGIDADKRLIAYVVAANGHAPLPDDLRAHLKQHLPAYMLPAAFVILEKLPLNQNGKLDRQALPEPQATPTAFAVPRTDTERALAEIWRAVLKVDAIGAHDNFFDIGGNSLTLLQVHARLRETFNTDLDVIELFQYPTLDALAARLTQPAKTETPLVQMDERAAKQRAARDGRGPRRA